MKMKQSKLAIREIKDSPLQLIIFLFCVTISVSSFVLLESFNYNVANYLDTDSKILAGGDIIVESQREYSNSLNQTINNLSDSYIKVNIYEFATNLYFSRSNLTSFSQLKVVGSNYPLYGNVELQSGRDISSINKEKSVLLDENLLKTLNVSVGENISIGNSEFTIEDVLVSEPDRAISLFSIGDRAMIFEQDIKSTGLIGDRSRVSYSTYFKIKSEDQLESLVTTLKENIQEREEVETFQDKQSTFSNFIDVFLSFMRLILFFTILLSGIGMVSTLNSFISKKQKTFAIMKTLGKNNVSLVQLLLLISVLVAFIGIILGTLLGLFLTYLVPIFFSDLLPTNFTFEFYYLAILKAISFALGLTILFSLIPISILKNIKPSSILQERNQIMFSFDKTLIILLLSLFLLMLYLVVSQFSNLYVAIGFIVAFILVFIIIYLITLFILKVSTNLRPKLPSLLVRQALSGFFRPGSKTVLFIATISTTLVLIFTIFILETNVEEQFIDAYPQDAPNMFFLDLRQDQLENFSTNLNYNFRYYPTISAGIVDVDGVDISTINENMDSRGDSVTRDFSLTYYETLLDDEILVQKSKSGSIFEQNWQSDKAQVSVMDTMVERLELEIGSEITFLIQGVEIQAEVVSIRQRTSSGVSPFFYFVFEPEVLRSAPQTIFTTATFEEERLNSIKNQVAREFPQVTAIDVSQSANRILKILNQLSSFILFFTSFSLLSGFLILVSSIISTSSQRLKEVIFYKLVGANKKFVLKIIFYEYFILGLLSSGIGLLLATLVTYIISTYFLEIEYTFFPLQSIVLLLVTCFVVVLIGLYSSIGLLKKKPIEYIKENNFE